MTGAANDPRNRARALRSRADGLMMQSSAIEARFDGGQPIILGHHSEAGARHDKAHSDALMRKAGVLYERARALDAGADAEERRAHAHTIREARPTITRDDVRPGDVVWTLVGTRTVPHRVVRVSAKSVSVETGYSWTDRLRYDEIVDVTRPGAA